MDCISAAREIADLSREQIASHEALAERILHLEAALASSRTELANAHLRNERLTAQLKVATAAKMEADERLGGALFLYSDIEKNRDAFCERLHTAGFAILRLPASVAAEVSAVRPLAAAFFARPEECKRLVSGEAGSVGGEGVGWRDKPEKGSEFLETYLTAAGTIVPAMGEDDDTALGAAIEVAHRRLTDVSRTLLRICAARVSLPPEALTDALELWEPGETSPLDPSAIGTSLLRVCHYRPSVPRTAGGPVVVPFAPHTDSTLLTLSPLCPTAAGLHLQGVSGDEDWIDIESLSGVCTRDVEVHAGDYLATLSRGYYVSLRHRVVCPADGRARISLPLLLRPRDEWRRRQGWLQYTADSDTTSSEEEVDEG